jgi:hypothetical protein
MHAGRLVVPPSSNHHIKGKEMAQRRITGPPAALSTELDQGDIYFIEILGGTYKIKRRFKRLRFMKLIVSDPVAALELIFVPGELDKLQELEMTDDELASVIEAISEVLTGGKKN